MERRKLNRMPQLNPLACHQSLIGKIVVKITKKFLIVRDDPLEKLINLFVEEKMASRAARAMKWCSRIRSDHLLPLHRSKPELNVMMKINRTLQTKKLVSMVKNIKIRAEMEF